MQARDWQVVARFIEQGVSESAQYRKVVDEVLGGARRRQFDTGSEWQWNRKPG